MPVSFVFSASVKTFVFELASYAVLISAFVWSAVAPLSIPSSLVPSVAISLLSTVPERYVSCNINITSSSNII
jgi:hypothetical protein